MFGKSYDKSLELMTSTQEEFSNIIKKFTDKIPSRLINALSNFRREAIVNYDQYAWRFVENGKSLLVSVGPVNRTSKDYMSLLLQKIGIDDYNAACRNEEVLIGTVSFCMYKNSSTRSAFIVRYECYLKKYDNYFCVVVKGKFNDRLSLNKELIEKMGLSEVVESLNQESEFYVDLKKSDFIPPINSKSANK